MGSEGGPVINRRAEWIYEFSKRAGPLLREIFEKDWNETPREITEQLERLRQMERKLQKRDLKS